MRDTDKPDPGTWARYIQAGRARLKKAPTEFGKLVGVRRQTVHRWEAGESVPTAYAVISAVADALGDEVSQALLAAGAKADAGSQSAKLRDDDGRALRVIRDAPLTPRVKAVLEGHLERLRARHEAERIAEIEEQIRLQIELQNPPRPGQP